MLFLQKFLIKIYNLKTTLHYSTYLIFFLQFLFPCILLSQNEQVRVEFKNSSPITSFAVSPDNQFLVQVKEDNSIILWNLFQGRVTMTFKGNRKRIVCIEISKDNIIIGGSNDGTLYFWTTTKESPIKEIEGHRGKINTLLVSDTILLSGGEDKSIKVWSLNKHNLLSTLSKHNSGIADLSLSKNKSELLSCSDTGEIVYWDFINKNFKRIIKVNNFPLQEIIFCKDEKYYFSIGKDNFLRKWHKKTGNELISMNLGKETSDLELITDNNLALTQGNSIAIWDINAKKIVNNFNGHAKKINSLVSYKDYYLTAGNDGIIKFLSKSNLSETLIINGFKGKNDFVVISSKGYFDGSENGIKTTKVNYINTTRKLNQQIEIEKKNNLLRIVLFGYGLNDKKFTHKYVVDTDLKSNYNFSADLLRKKKYVDVTARIDTFEFCPTNKNIRLGLKLRYARNSLGGGDNIKVFNGDVNATSNDLADLYFSHTGTTSRVIVIGGRKYEEKYIAATENLIENPSGCLTFIFKRNGDKTGGYGWNGILSTSNRKKITEQKKKPKKEILVSSGTKQKNRALIFAVSEYESFTNLPNSILNGEELKKTLESNFDFEVAFYKNPTRPKVLSAIDSIARLNYDSLDQVLIYFSGHGSQEEEEHYNKTTGLLHTSDSNEENIIHTSIQHEDFRNRINSMKCEHILVILNACQSAIFGESVNNGLTNGGESKCKKCNEKNKNDILDRELKIKSRLYLASGEKNTFTGSHTSTNPFTTVLLEALDVSKWGEKKYYTGFLDIRLSLSKADLNPDPKGGSFAERKNGEFGNFIFYKKDDR